MVLGRRLIGDFLKTPSERSPYLGEKGINYPLKTTEQKVVQFIQEIFCQATDPTMVVPMLLASPVYHGGKVGLLRSFLARPAQTWMGRGLTLQVLPALGGFGAETLAFSLSSRALRHYLQGPEQWNASNLVNDTAMTGMSLGFLKAMGFAGTKIVGGALGLNEFHGALWTQAGQRAMFWGAQLSGYLGLVGSHYLQGTLFPGPHPASGNIWVDALGTHLALGLGALGGRSLMGSYFHAMEQGLGFKAHRLHREAARPFGPLGLSSAALATGGGGLADRVAPHRSIFFNQGMDPNGPRRGAFPSKPPRASGFQIKDPRQSILQTLRGEGSSETVRDFFSGFSDQELLKEIGVELKNLEGFSPGETEIIRMRFLNEHPTSVHEMGRALEYSHEWARGMARSVAEKLVSRLLLRLNRHNTLDPVPIEALVVSPRVKSFFARANTKTIGDLLRWTEQDISKSKNVGPRSVHGLKKELARLGLALEEVYPGEVLLRDAVREGLVEFHLGKSLEDFVLNATALEIRTLFELRLQGQSKFDPREIEIVKRRFLSDPPATWAEIAEQYDMEISPARASVQGILKDFLHSLDRKLSIPVERLPLSARALNGLDRLQVHSVGELVRRSADELLSHRNMGKKSVGEIRMVLARMGLSLSND